MTDPIDFTSRTARFGLPFLFPGQAQKELFINESLSLIDTILQPVVEDRLATPPSQPEEGSCWLVSPNATDEWAGQDDKLACFQAGAWLFVDPFDEMRVYDRGSRVQLQFRDEWLEPQSVASPAGGEVIDSEARRAVGELIEALAKMGLVSKFS